MFELHPPEPPVVDETAAGSALLGPEPSEMDRERMTRVLAAEADLEAAAMSEARVDAAGGRVDADLVRLRALGGDAFTYELFARTAFARGMRTVHAFMVEALAQDRAWTGTTRSEALELAEHDLAAALGVSRRTAQIRIQDAGLLVEACSRTLAVLEAGYLSVPAARELAHRLSDLPEDLHPGLRPAVEAAVLDQVGAPAGVALGRMDLDEMALEAGLRPSQVATVSLGASRARVRDLVARCARELTPAHPTPDAAAEADSDEDVAASLETGRSVAVGGDVEAWPTRPGYVFVGSEMTEGDATLVLDRNDHLARTSKRAGDLRSVPELRGAWFRDLLLADDGGRPGLRPVPVHLTVHLLDDRTTVDTDRLGPFSAHTLAELVAAAGDTGGRIRTRRVERPECHGHVVLEGAVTEPGPYVVPPRLREAVIARDRTCRFPGCAVPARSCDLDHSVPHPRGPTCACNLGCLCRGHHRLKTSGRWRLTNHGHGRLTWTSPTGRTFEVGPDPP